MNKQRKHKPNIPDKFPAKGWRKVKVGNIIRATDVWAKYSGNYFVADAAHYNHTDEKYIGTTPLYRKCKI